MSLTDASPFSAEFPAFSITPSDVTGLLSTLLSHFKPRGVPLSQWRNEVLIAYQSRSTNTRISMRTALRELVAIAGDDATTLELTPALIDQFANRPGRASATNRLLGALRCAIKLAQVRGYVRPNLVDLCRFRVPDHDVPKRRHHSRETIRAVLEQLRIEAVDWRSRRLYVFASILAYTGLRSGEAKRVRVEDVDFDRGFLWVRPNGKSLKTRGSEAPVPMPEVLAGILREWIGEVGSEWLIPMARKTGPWTGGRGHARAGDCLRDRALAMGVEGFTPLSLRHSLATHLTGYWRLSRGQVKLILRHTTEMTQDYYVHPDLVNLRETVRDFDFVPRPFLPDVPPAAPPTGTR